MKRWRSMLLLIVLFSAGCASDKGQWDEFWRDVRGDNMKMRGFADKPLN